MRFRPDVRVRPVTTAAMLTTVAVTMVGCVATSPQSPATHKARMVGGTVQPEYAGSATTRQNGVAQQSPRSAPNVSSGAQQPRRARLTPSDEPGAATGEPPNPCKLASQAEVQAIARMPVTRQVEAPLGPTCIYTLRPSAADITLTVEPLSLAQAHRQLQRPSQVTIAGHKGYCGILGRQTLYLSVASGTVLQVTAACPVARRIAATAIGRIAA